jgi:hypothetical protein
MKKLTLALVALLGLVVRSQATVTIDVSEVAGNVVFTASGSLDLSGAIVARDHYSSYGLGFISGGDNWYVGMGAGTDYTSYALTSFDGAFGTSLTYYSSPSSTSGDNFFIWGQGGIDPRQVAIYSDYISGSAISSVMTFNGTTIADLFMTAGVYNYTIPNDNIVLRINDAAGVPDSGSTVALLGLALLGVAGIRRRIR